MKMQQNYCTGIKNEGYVKATVRSILRDLFMANYHKVAFHELMQYLALCLLWYYILLLERVSLSGVILHQCKMQCTKVQLCCVDVHVPILNIRRHYCLYSLKSLHVSTCLPSKFKRPRLASSAIDGPRSLDRPSIGNNRHRRPSNSNNRTTKKFVRTLRTPPLSAL
jgi:hypothetical protein